MAIDFPSSPTEGQVHNVSPGRSFVSRGGVWVPAPMKTALPKNYLVNPYMQVSQQNGRTQYMQGVTQSGGAAGTTATYYTADQWASQWSWGGMSSTVGIATYSDINGNVFIEFVSQGPN